jgi:hypothetical protein
MAKLAPPNLPLYLYRYRSLSPRQDERGRIRPTIYREIAALREPYIWCADFNRLNDPMEGFYRPSKALRKRDESDRIMRALFDKKLNVGIASLSDTKENELMWTHYTGNYAGICIQYYARRLLDALPDDVTLVRMGYDDIPPRVSGRDTKEMEEAARKILSQKKYNWSYEREWRILGAVGKVEIGSKVVVKSIYLGSRIKPQHRDAILKALDSSEVDIYEMNVDGYKHAWNPIQGPLFKNRVDARKKRRSAARQ